MFSHDDHTKVTPKDFVLYAGLMISLYWSAVNLGVLWFEYIDRLFPDRLDSYVDPLSGTIRFAMASLFVMVPIFLFLSFYINKEIRQETAKAGLWIRKWLLYISLLIAGVAVAVDLIVLVNTFLAGEVTVRFLLKALTVFAIAGGGFAYYLMDIRGFWREHVKESQGIGGMVGFVVVVSIIAGFLIAGSPSTQRDLRFDQQRVYDLQSIQYQVVDYWQSKQELPMDLSQLEDSITGYVVPTDPETSEGYFYSTTGVTTFELCATFARESQDITTERLYPTGVTQESWSHPEGTHCFQREIDPERFPPKEVRVPVG